MQCLSIALAFAGMIASAVATPTPELGLAARGAVYRKLSKDGSVPVP